MRPRWAALGGLALLLAGCGGFAGVRLFGDAGACGVAGLEAVAVEPVEGPGACGIARPVAVTRVAGVALSRPTTMTCETARALDRWMRKGVPRSTRRRGGGLVSVDVAAGYSCRTRNGVPGARLSEHARGTAIDISGFRFADGSRLSVEAGWRGRWRDRRALRRMHRRACGIFDTVLGPDADRHHRDHFHFDLARRRSGAYCR